MWHPPRALHLAVNSSCPLCPASPVPPSGRGSLALGSPGLCCTWQVHHKRCIPTGFQPSAPWPTAEHLLFRGGLARCTCCLSAGSHIIGYVLSSSHPSLRWVGWEIRSNSQRTAALFRRCHQSAFCRKDRVVYNPILSMQRPGCRSAWSAGFERKPLLDLMPLAKVSS